MPLHVNNHVKKRGSNGRPRHLPAPSQTSEVVSKRAVVGATPSRFEAGIYGEAPRLARGFLRRAAIFPLTRHNALIKLDLLNPSAGPSGRQSGGGRPARATHANGPGI